MIEVDIILFEVFIPLSLSNCSSAARSRSEQRDEDCCRRRIRTVVKFTLRLSPTPKFIASEARQIWFEWGLCHFAVSDLGPVMHLLFWASLLSSVNRDYDTYLAGGVGFSEMELCSDSMRQSPSGLVGAQEMLLSSHFKVFFLPESVLWMVGFSLNIFKLTKICENEHPDETSIVWMCTGLWVYMFVCVCSWRAGMYKSDNISRTITCILPSTPPFSSLPSRKQIH